jgi:hypothetical protein
MKKLLLTLRTLRQRLAMEIPRQLDDTELRVYAELGEVYVALRALEIVTTSLGNTYIIAETIGGIEQRDQSDCAAMFYHLTKGKSK